MKVDLCGIIFDDFYWGITILFVISFFLVTTNVFS